MEKDNVIVDKSKVFALRIIKMYKYLCDEKKEFVLSKQVQVLVLIFVKVLGGNLNLTFMQNYIYP